MKCLLIALVVAVFCFACEDDTETKDAAPADTSPDVVVVDQALEQSAPDAQADAAPGDDAGVVEDMAVPDSSPVEPGTWVTIPAGTFTMGSPSSEPCRYSNETQRQVTLTRDFEIWNTETTQGEFEALMGYNPSYFSSCGANCPVENVNWHESVAYCNALSDQAGLDTCYSCTESDADVACEEATAYSGQQIYDCPGYRLPTEAEWEYAYRAGSNTPFYPSSGNDGSITVCTGSNDSNADKIGWYRYNSAVSYAGCWDLSPSGGDACSGTPPMGLKAPNAWGLYDMAGNVWEWCHDWYQADLGSSSIIDPWGPAPRSSRVLRGGSWNLNARNLRAAFRYFNYHAHRYYYGGFRCVRTK
jgi:formylglycine-generating enzyme required for sulfatase activity